jgi:hypothetical protein
LEEVPYVEDDEDESDYSVTWDFPNYLGSSSDDDNDDNNNNNNNNNNNDNNNDFGIDLD